MMPRTSFFVAVLAASSVLMACSSDTGKPSDGTTSGGTPASTASSASTEVPDAAAPEAGPAKKALIEGCVKDDDCASGTCYIGDQGSYCSIKCTAENAAAACIAPLAGTCNKKGFCKKP